MKISRGCMKNEKTIYIIIAIAFCIVLSANIHSSIKSYRYRRLCDQYRTELIATEEANRELADRIGRVTEVVGRLHETSERNVKSSRGIIETVEILRMQIQELENCCGGFNQSEYYQYWDSYYHDEQLME